MPKNPVFIIILILLIVLLFGSSKLPDLARNLGRSMRIVKKEFREMKAEDEASAQQPVQTPPAVAASAPDAPQAVPPAQAPPTAPAAPTAQAASSTPAEPAGDDAPKA